MSNKIVTIHQPEYLPWLGFFDRIDSSDVFVFLDDAGYQKNGFMNRNKIKTKDGWQWLTIPVEGRSPNRKMNEVLVDNTKNWRESLLDKIRFNYQKSPFFNDYFSFFQEAFKKKWEKISDLDIYLIENVINFLGLKKEVKKTSEMMISGTKTERLVNICKEIGADTYLSGPGGKSYMNMDLFRKANINVVFQEFSHPEYSQQFKENGFLPYMSIIDLLFNCGEKSLEIIKSGSKTKL